MNARFALFAMVLAAGCSSPPSARVVTGQLRVSTAGLARPVVVAESSDRRVFVADVGAGGRFALTLPPDASYRLTLAATVHPSRYSAVARINWPLAGGAARWATLGGGGTLDLGQVYKRGTRPPGGVGIACDRCGGSSSGGDDGGVGDDGGGCHEDDHASTTEHHGDYDCDCDHAPSGDDHCDRDDDGDAHEHACQADDDDKSGDYDHDDDDGDDDDDGTYGGHACDGGAPTPTPPPAGSPDMAPVA